MSLWTARLRAFAMEQGLQAFEGSMGRLLTACVPTAFATGGNMFLVSLVLVVVAVETKEFPVTPIGWVVVVVVVSVVDGQLAQVGMVEISAAASTDPGVEL